MKSKPIFTGVKIGTALCAAVFVAGCVNNPAASSNIIDATIQFDADGCPTAANANLTRTGKPGQRIRFTSDPLKNGNEFNEFVLTFDPFVGRTYESKNGVEITTPLSASSIPSKHGANQTQFKYKFVINAEGCEPIDPMIIIDR